jgi:hypothetical protein
MSVQRKRIVGEALGAVDSWKSPSKPCRKPEKTVEKMPETAHILSTISTAKRWKECIQ